MPLLIPTTATPSQTLAVTLGGQSCRIDIRQRAFGLFVDLYIRDDPIVLGALALNLTRLVRSVYLGFIGDLCIFDTAGTSDPSYEQLGSRYVLLWYDAGELA